MQFILLKTVSQRLLKLSIEVKSDLTGESRSKKINRLCITSATKLPLLSKAKADGPKAANLRGDFSEKKIASTRMLGDVGHIKSTTSWNGLTVLSEKKEVVVK